MSTTTAHDDYMSNMAVVQWHTGDGDGADIIFECDGKHIAVSMFPNHTAPRALENHLIDLLGQAVGFDDNYDSLMDEVYDTIMDIGLPLFTQVLQTAQGSPPKQVLHSLLYPPTFHFCLRTTARGPEIVEMDRSKSYTDPEINFESNFDSAFQLESDLPKHSSKEVYIIKSLLSGGAVNKVLVDGREMLCKARRSGLYDSNLEKELESMQKIYRASRSGEWSVQVPRLLGYVMHAENGHIIGMLREWIASGLPHLRDLDVKTIARDRREKWIAQIRRTVKNLHDIGVIWGDGKIDNVVIGEDDEAWLIDFGGGWTDGWVDEELADTVKGDEQAITNIARFLDID